MGRKGIKSKLLMCLMAETTVVTGILGSIPLPVKAAEEGNYTVTFEAYEGACDTESISVPKGESLTLPEAAYEGHYLESWMDITNNDDVTKFTAVGKPGDTYTPERDLWLYANWKANQEQEPVEDITATYEARIGDTNYEELEEAFANAQAGDTIIVLKDCSVSKTLEVTADNITLQSEDAENPSTIRRDREFTGKIYTRADMHNVLLGIEGSLTLCNIILDGGAQLDGDFNNAGQEWDSPLIYVTGACIMEDGTTLQNNYNTDNNEDNRTSRTAGAVHVEWGGTFTMGGGLIQHCCTNGAGGGIQTGGTSSATITSGTIRECYAMVGGAAEFSGSTNASGMNISGNKARAAIVAVHGEVILSDCLIENNEVTGDSGTVGVSQNFPVTIERCTIAGNRNRYTSAISYSGINRTEPLMIRDCTIRGNYAEDSYGGTAIDYMTKADLILDGKIVMEGNTVADDKAWDIRFYYQDTTPVTLGPDFESDSTFVLWGRDFTSGTLLVDAASNGKEADASQFVWKTDDYRTEEKEGNIYLAEVPKTYSVTYDANNSSTGIGSVVCSDPNDYTSEDTVAIMGEAELFPLMGNLVNFGYDFDGWNTQADGKGTDYAPGQEINLTSDLYLYAKWKAKDLITLTYVYNGGTGETESEQVIPGANIAFPDASREGYRFQGWYEDEELTVFAGNAGEKHYAPQQDAFYYAAWEKTHATVTFDADGGKMEGGDVIAKIGDTVTLPDCTKDDYEFVGWYDGGTCTGQAGEEYILSDDVTLKAHYVRKEAPICTVSFDTDGGKEISPVKVEKGQKVKLPEAEKEGNTFLGWYTAKEGGTRLNAEITVAEDTTIYARWEKESEKPEERPEAAITFDADGGEMEGGDITAKVGDTITLPVCTKEGYEFTGWYDKDICAGQAGEKYTVIGDVTLKAHYEKEEEITCLITFDPNGGRKAEAVRAVKGEKVTLPGTEKSGYVFLGWYTEKKGGILLGLAGDRLEVTKDMTVYALWEKEKTGETGDKDQETCKAVFHTDGGTLKNQTVTIAKGAGLYLPLPEKKGCDFTGWYLDKSLTQFAGAYRDAYRITEDTDFYAKWEKSKEDHTENDNEDQDDHVETTGIYTVKYDANGGTVKEPYVKVTKGTGIKLPAAEREGFTFTGWYTDKQLFVGKAGDTYKPDKDISLYAGWKKADSSNTNGSTAESGSNYDAESGTSGQDKNADTSATEKSGNTASGAGTEKEPVIQTGRTSPVCLFAVLGMFGVLLAAFSVREGKHSSGK